MGARRIFFQRGANLEASQGHICLEGHICLVSTCGTPMSAVVFHSVEKSLRVSLCQTLCMNRVLQNTEKQNPGGHSFTQKMKILRYEIVPPPFGLCRP